MTTASPAPLQRFDVGPRLSEMAIHNGTVYLAGQLADDYAGDIRQQTRETLANIVHLAHLTRAELIQQRRQGRSLIYTADYAAMNALWDAWVAEGAAPARACVEARLYDPRVRVEMTLTAAL